MIRVAFLVLAHREPEHCRRLIHALAHDRCATFVHVDAKADARQFFVQSPDVFFSARRIHVNRGGWSLTLAIESLLQQADRAGDFDYFALLAGTDYLLRPVSEFCAFLRQQVPVSFVNYYPLVPGAGGIENVFRYQFVDFCFRLKTVIGSSRNSDDRPDLFPTAIAHINRLLPRRRFPSGFFPFRGSNRWVLHRSAVKFLLHALESTNVRPLRRYLGMTWGSDEVLFQTIIFNSEIAADCAQYDRAEVHSILTGSKPPWEDERRPFLHYVDWDPSREDPAVLDDRDFDAIRESGKFFACKFLHPRSLQLLGRIDRELLGFDTIV
jgi:hypothetical protein